MNKMVAYNLTADGYGVTSALNARTAADAIRQREFNLVLLDINLPDGNGFELCKLIKPQDVYKRQARTRQRMVRIAIRENEKCKEQSWNRQIRSFRSLTSTEA